MSDPETSRLVVAVTEHLRWVDSLPDRERSLAIAGVPLAEWERVKEWTAETIGLMNGSLVRKWTGQYWTTVRSSDTNGSKPRPTSGHEPDCVLAVEPSAMSSNGADSAD
jgi:hypothetical protein